ncbi:MAG: F-box protein [Cytophagales bacterium]|nr:F-box protein [Cytophagales bacterium]
MIDIPFKFEVINLAGGFGVATMLGIIKASPLLRRTRMEDIEIVKEVQGVQVNLPDELWLHIFSFLNYDSYCSIRLVCKRFYMIGKEPVLSPAPCWSKQSINRRRCFQFHRALSKSKASLGNQLTTCCRAALLTTVVESQMKFELFLGREFLINIGVLYINY